MFGSHDIYTWNATRDKMGQNEREREKEREVIRNERLIKGERVDEKRG